MEPNKYGLIRNPLLDLIAVDFDIDLKDTMVEVVHPEYIAGSRFNTDGTLIEDPYYKYSIVDVSKYSYVILPISNNTSSTLVITGMRPTESSGTLYPRQLSARWLNARGFVLAPVDVAYACVTTPVDKDFIILGIKSDNSNRSLNQSLISEYTESRLVLKEPETEQKRK